MLSELEELLQEVDRLQVGLAAESLALCSRGRGGVCHAGRSPILIRARAMQRRLEEAERRDLATAEELQVLEEFRVRL